MAKIRVYELAKKLGIPSNRLIDELRALGVEVQSNFSTLDETVMEKLGGKKAPAKAHPPAAEGAKPSARDKAAPAKPATRPAEPAKPAPAKPGASPAPARPPVPAAQVRATATQPRSPQPAKPAAPQAPARPPATPPPRPAEAPHAASRPAGQAVRPGAAAPPAPPARPTAPSHPQSAQPPQGARQPGPGYAPRQGQPALSHGPRPSAPQRPGQGRPAQLVTGSQRPGGPYPRPGAPSQQRPGMPSHRPGSQAQGPSGRPAAPARPAYPPRPAPGATGAPPARPGEAPRPAGRFAPAPEARRKTKRERRLEKLQARADRRERLEHEIEEARIQAETGEAVFIREGITVKELAEKLNVKVKDVIAKLMTRGIFATINQPLDSQVAIQVCSMFGFAAEVISYEDELVLTQEEAPEEDKVPRAPVVTVMGHVDHGKSSLLEAIHDVDITSKEFGGITQHIGAYRVRHKEREYVFLDTPGHEAFTLMRARGAQVTDIVVLVVAADDGVMPQTVEAINHCKAANVPMVVAINKMDKPGADPDRVKRELSAQGILTEDWGGEVVSVPVSAKSRQGIEELLEMVSLVADMLNLKAAPDQPASGTVLESRLDRARGPVATVLIQDGSIGIGDLFLCGSTHGHVRGMFDDKGNRVEKAGPSIPVEILGFPEVPAVGALFQGMTDEARARQIASFRKEQDKAKSLRTSKVRLDNVFGAIKQGEIEELPLILKADVQGSLEAISQKVLEVTSDEVKMNVVHQGVGAISESDILLASASNALVIGFNVRPERKAVDLAKAEGVEIHLFTVIYDLIDRLKQALTGMLKPIQEEVVLGHAEVRDIFKITKVGTIAGCLVADGRISRVAQIRLLRDNVVVFTGKVASLKRFKDDASEVKEGLECGIGLENYNDVKPGDVLESFEIHFQERTL